MASKSPTTTAAAQTIAALRSAPAPVGLFEIEEGCPDKALLTCWNHRQQLLAVIETAGRFYDADITCPGKSEAFDLLESSIPKMPALTVQGVIAKLWIALAHTGPHCSNEIIRAESDTIRRADFAEVEAFEDRLDFEQEAIFQTIRDLRHWLKFEQVGFLPQRRAA